MITFKIFSENMDHSKDHQAVDELKTSLLAKKDHINSLKNEDDVYEFIDKIMTRIAKSHGLSGQKLHDMWVKKYKEIPDTWIMNEACWKGYKAVGGKMKNGKMVPNCVPEETEINEKEFAPVKHDKSGLPKKYVAGLTPAEIKAKKAHIARTAKMSDRDPAAYKDMPGDKRIRAKGIPQSKYTKKYHAMYGEEVEQIGEAMYTFRQFKNPLSHSVTKHKTVGVTQTADGKKGANILKHAEHKGYFAAGGSSTGFKKGTTLHKTPLEAAKAYHKQDVKSVSEGKADTSIAAKAQKSGISASTLRKVYNRGVAAWNSGHRPGTTPAQWGHARVNSYITKGKTYHTADKDLHERIMEKWSAKYKASIDCSNPKGFSQRAHCQGKKKVEEFVGENVKKVLGTNCKNCIYWDKHSEKHVDKSELNENGGLKAPNKAYLEMSKRVDMVSLPGKATVNIKAYCDNDNVKDFVTERMCCAYWDGEGTKREYKGKPNNPELKEHIIKVGKKYRLVSKETGKNLGTYPTKAGAEKRERQVQYFKHAK
jgi:Family of unknown function (DUF5824)